MSIVIGPARIADGRGTHEPGSVIDDPSLELQALAADESAIHPESGLSYASVQTQPLITPEPPLTEQPLTEEPA